MKCPNCGKELKYEKATGMSKYKYLCTSCDNEYEIDMKGNIRRLSNFKDIFGDIFGGNS